jgi:DNA-binding transcriptional MerR regulator
MSEPPVGLLRVHAKKAPWNARGLAAYATALADAAGMRPTNSSARAELSARGIRFYAANGLIDRPEGRGTAATYGYRHLLQLLAIKIRQREGQTLEVIKRELAQVTGDALERRVAQALAPALAGASAPASSSGEAVHTQWHRVVIAPGAELHVRFGTRAASDDMLIAMRDAARAVLGDEVDR